jgi:hypothetical protein
MTHRNGITLQSILFTRALSVMPGGHCKLRPSPFSPGGPSSGGASPEGDSCQTAFDIRNKPRRVEVGQLGSTQQSQWHFCHQPEVGRTWVQGFKLNPVHGGIWGRRLYAPKTEWTMERKWQPPTRQYRRSPTAGPIAGDTTKHLVRRYRTREVEQRPSSYYRPSVQHRGPSIVVIRLIIVGQNEGSSSRLSQYIDHPAGCQCTSSALGITCQTLDLSTRQTKDLTAS